MSKPDTAMAANATTNSDATAESTTSTQSAALEAMLYSTYYWESWFALCCDFVADALTLLSIASGFLVSILLVADTLRVEAVMVLSAVVPGASLLIIKGLRLVERGQWHWIKAQKFYVWHFGLTHGVEQPEEIIREVMAYYLSMPEYPSRDVEKIDRIVKSRGKGAQPIG